MKLKQLTDDELQEKVYHYERLSYYAVPFKEQLKWKMERRKVTEEIIRRNGSGIELKPIANVNNVMIN